MKDTQKKAIIGAVIKMLLSFKLPRKEYLERKQGLYDYVYGSRNEKNIMQKVKICGIAYLLISSENELITCMKRTGRLYFNSNSKGKSLLG